MDVDCTWLASKHDHISGPKKIPWMTTILPGKNCHTTEMVQNLSPMGPQILVYVQDEPSNYWGKCGIPPFWDFHDTNTTRLHHAAASLCCLSRQQRCSKIWRFPKGPEILGNRLKKHCGYIHSWFFSAGSAKFWTKILESQVSGWCL